MKVVTLYMNPTLIFLRATPISTAHSVMKALQLNNIRVQREIIANKGVISVLRAIRQSDSNRIYDSLNVGL
jgi:hypothetical protein